jgi:UDP-glucose 6-dehydrogenase
MRISVIGTGHLGAVHAACVAELGHDVLGVTNDAEKIAALVKVAASPFFATKVSFINAVSDVCERLLHGRNLLPLGRWRAAGWTVQSMGASSAAVSAEA